MVAGFIGDELCGLSIPPEGGEDILPHVSPNEEPISAEKQMQE